MRSTRGFTDATKNQEIPIPDYLNVAQLINTCCLCYCKRKWYKEYTKTLSVINKDIDSSLDILNLLRRLRMHGFGVSTLYGAEERKFIAKRAESTPLNEVMCTQTGGIWQGYERMLKRDKHALCLFQKYRQIKKNERKQEQSKQDDASRGKNSNFLNIPIQQQFMSTHAIRHVSRLSTGNAKNNLDSLLSAKKNKGNLVALSEQPEYDFARSDLKTPQLLSVKRNEPVLSGTLVKKNKFMMKQHRNFYLYLNGEIKYYEGDEYKGTIQLTPDKKAYKVNSDQINIHTDSKNYTLYQVSNYNGELTSRDEHNTNNIDEWVRAVNLVIEDLD